MLKLFIKLNSLKVKKKELINCLISGQSKKKYKMNLCMLAFGLIVTIYS